MKLFVCCCAVGLLLSLLHSCFYVTVLVLIMLHLLYVRPCAVLLLTCAELL
jgi:hypothetical protein